MVKLTPEIVLDAYRLGYFPMAESAEDKEVFFLSPEERGQLSITNMHIPKSLLKAIAKEPYEVRINSDFENVIRSCAEQTPGRDNTWINESIIELFIELSERGYAHSVECWDGDELVGGLYGLALGSAFFGESMFSRKVNSSKIALVHLVARLWVGGYTILDTQWSNPHLEQFGCFEISKEDYLQKLGKALLIDADFMCENDSLRNIISKYLAFRKTYAP